MAEKGAHLTQTALHKPSIFEVVAQHTLSSTIQPALRRVVEFLGSSHPERYGFLVKWYDELYMSLNFFLQKHYLSYYDGSFSEIFYGLCRLSVKNGIEENLKNKERVLSLLHEVFLPYIWQKVDKAVQKLKENDAGEPQIEGRKKEVVYLILKTYNLCRITWESAVLYYYITYLGGKSRFHSPLFHLFGLALCYSDSKEEDILTTAWEDASIKNRWFSPRRIGRGLLNVLEMGAFLLQFLQWWQAEQYTTDLSALPVPSPPPQISEDRELKKICPLCRKSWRLETLLPVSGYVFCFRCIMQYVQKHRTCPVTGYPASAQDLVRLFK